MIQSVITRLAGNSALLKGWSAALIATVSALLAKDKVPELAIILVVPATAFMCLDAYYLMLERCYRDLYNQVARIPTNLLDGNGRIVSSYPLGPVPRAFSMAIRPTRWQFLFTLRRPAIWAFHLPILAVVLGVFSMGPVWVRRLDQPAMISPPRTVAQASSPLVFISYSKRDERFLEEFELHLDQPIREGRLQLWNDKKIAPGSAWEDDLTAKLRDADVGVILVTARALASPYIRDVELPALSKKKVTWVPIEAVDYRHSVLKDIAPLWAPDRPLANMSVPDRAKAWVQICDGLLRTVHRVK